MVTRIGIVATVLAFSLTAQDKGIDFFEKKIRPVLAAQCYACHSSAVPVAKGGLLLDSAVGLKRAIPLLPAALKKMPPGKPVAKEIAADFERWIAEGAPTPYKQPELWSLQKPRADKSGSIDRFISDRLKAKNLTLSPEADRRTLIRRAAYDLIGLPPSIDDLENAQYEQYVDRLLASPRYGERWARHWLDVARYSDSVNDSVNAGQRYPWSYTYRDWVIQSLNEDLPYDKFLLYQLAADRIPNTDKKHLAALGFLSLGRDFPNSYPETVDDRIDAVTRGMLGFTVACARCHDHKYDPIPTKDYYSLYSIFSNIRQPKEFPLIVKQESASPKQSLYQERLAKIRQADLDYRARRHAEMIAFFKSQAAEYEKATQDAKGLSNPQIEELVRERQLNLHVLNRYRAGVPSPADVPLEEFEKIYTEGDSNNTRSIRVRYNTMLARSAYDGAAPRAMAIEDVPDAPPGHVFIRGNPNNPGELAPPRFLSCLNGKEGGRLDLAKAIIDPENPLTARAIVNRVWMHHFGSGIVRTPSDFGFRGEPPTHPELLDYLAVNFVESGWSLKKLHRTIMMSAAYKQSSADNEAARKIDPDNQFLWRMNRRRIEIESLRDSMLAAAGRLDLTAGGVPFPLTAQPSIPRRSVYGFIERGRVPALLNAFDFASPDQHAPMRFVTTVPQQALFFLNSPFIAEQAQHLAARAKDGEASQRIQKLYKIAFGRTPTQAELAAGLKFVSQDAAEPSQPSGTSPWQYGIGGDTFSPFQVFISDRWQASPHATAFLRATGGEPGEHANEAVVRRWISPIAAKINIEGTFRHGQPAVPYGDGVRGRIVSSRLGEIASWAVNGSSAETKLNGIAVEKGDTIDFIVDARRDPEGDGFGWTPVIKSGDQTWNAKDDFAGPAPQPLSVWARYAQVLLETNEFAFID